GVLGRACVEAMRGAAPRAGLETAERESVGIGAPGSIDTGPGPVVQVANVVGLDEPFPLAPTVASRLGVPVSLGNDVNVAVDAERRYGAGRGYRSFLGVFWGTGVGGGLVVEGRRLLWRRSAGARRDGRAELVGGRRH